MAAVTDGSLVLLVDDDADARSILAEILAGAGYAVQTASDGGDALERLRGDGDAARPRVILLDVSMPRMDGFGFYAAQQADPALASIPLIVLWGHGRPETLPVGVEVLPKPTSLEGLLRVVARYCA